MRKWILHIGNLFVYDENAFTVFDNLWGARNRVGIVLLYRPVRLSQPGGIGFLESILGLLKILKIRALFVLSVWQKPKQ